MRALAAILIFAPVLFAGDEEAFFESKVRPLLAAKCHACHAESEMGGLRLDSAERVLQGGSRGPAVVPWDPDESLLLAAVRRSRQDLRMPPTEELAEAEIAILENWIASGAVWPTSAEATAGSADLSAEARSFWSFLPVRRPAVPDGDSPSPIDRFVLEDLRWAGLEPAPPAEKSTLIRRLSLDLLGMPPTPEETSAFLADHESGAYERLVDRLLGSPRYGERMARRWLDLARYADGQSAAYEDTPLENAWRYRDWVVDAFNQDLPYDRFVVYQLAADLLSEPESSANLPALGFHALRDRDDDRVDVTGRTFLALTIGCAECHDHKFDPIPQADFYAMQGVFGSTEAYRHALAPPDVVEAHEAAVERVQERKRSIDAFLERERDQLIDVFMERTAEFLLASHSVLAQGADPERTADKAGLDRQTLDRWTAYLESRPHQHHFLDDWHAVADAGGSESEMRRAAADFEAVLLSIHAEKRAVDDRNYVKLGGAEGARTQRTLLNTNLEFLEPERYYLWRDMAAPPARKRGLPFVGGVYYYGPDGIERFLSGVWSHYLRSQKADLKWRQAQVPALYPFLHAYRDSDTPKDARIAIRGDRKNLGATVPRRFLAVLSPDEPARFEQGSGRMELARAIASPQNPLTARVFANRLWQWRFGRGIVATPSNFGQLGERPSHPGLLDWLAAEFVDGGWSVKALDRAVLLSEAYRRSSSLIAKNYEADPGNRLFWRFSPVERLDAETLRDSLLAVSDGLDLALGGPPEDIGGGHARRTLYATVDRTNPDPGLALFDFPDSKTHSPQRDSTVGPLQRLYYLNNPFFIERSASLAARLADDAGSGVDGRVRRAYELLFSRPPEPAELAAALAYLANETWERYCQVLLASSEFLTVR
ncbi:MAG: PSD1 and planctomycete cytochrome C domain-containing protein [Bryobacterales bacterium]|nr:PSD1 and planctomycete cytochrome C domain-containing protein [Bryobacterales bacterium]